MKALCYRLISLALVVSIAALPFSTHAGIIGTNEVVASAQAQSNRDKVLNFAARADVQRELAARGVDAGTAKERVSTLTDDEVQELAGRIDSLPAGGHGGIGLAGVLIIVLVVILLVFALDKGR